MPRRTAMPFSKETSSECHNASFTNLIRKDSGPGPRKVTNGLNTTNWTKNHSPDETYQLLCLKRRMIQKMPLKTTYSGPDSISNLISIRKINMEQSLADKPWNKAKVGYYLQGLPWNWNHEYWKRIWSDDQTQQHLKAWSKWDIMCLLYSLKNLEERKMVN